MHDHCDKASKTRQISFLIAVTALMLAGSLPAGAGSISVAPLRLTFSPGKAIASITVENNGTDESLVQAETFAWSQVGTEHTLVATDDMVAVPPVFKLVPGARQIVRVGLTRNFADREEKTFRLTVTELPTVATPGTVAVAVRHSLPVFVLPATPGTQKLVVKRGLKGGIELFNGGTQHLRIHRWRLRDRDGAVLAEEQGPGYLLANARLPLAGADKILLPDAQQKAGPFVFEADYDTSTLKIALEE